MMNFRHIHKTRKRAAQKTLAVFGLIILLFGFVVLFPKAAPQIILEVGRPVSWINKFVRDQAGAFYLFVSGRRALVREVVTLRALTSRIELELALLKGLENDNRELYRVYNWEPEGGIIAAVSTRPPYSPYDTFVIDAGRRDGVISGDFVLVGDHLIIGEISEVFSNFSKVKAFSSPGEKIKVLLAGANVLTTAVGAGGGSFTVKLAQGVEVLVGERVILPIMPLAVFGFVEHIEKNETDPFQVVYFTAPINFSELRFVKIIRPPDVPKMAVD